MKQKISLSNFLFQKQNHIQLELFIYTSRSNKVSRNTVRQFKLAQFVKQRVAYSRRSEYKLIRNGSILGEENKNIKGENKVSSETKKYLEFCKLLALNNKITN